MIKVNFSVTEKVKLHGWKNMNSNKAVKVNLHLFCGYITEEKSLHRMDNIRWNFVKIEKQILILLDKNR